jgi:hypothetical protein
MTVVHSADWEGCIWSLGGVVRGVVLDAEVEGSYVVGLSLAFSLVLVLVSASRLKLRLFNLDTVLLIACRTPSPAHAHTRY